MGCRCRTAGALSTGETCEEPGQLLGLIGFAHEVLGEEACTSAEPTCVDQGRRACDRIRTQGHQGSRDCYSFSLYRGEQTKSSFEYYNPKAEYYRGGVRLTPLGVCAG